MHILGDNKMQSEFQKNLNKFCIAFFKREKNEVINMIRDKFL